MRRMDTTPSDSNAIDLFIKYGAAIGAVAYGLGLLEQYDFFERVGIRGDFSFTDPRYFALGTYLLGQAMFPLAAVSFEIWLSALLYPERGASKIPTKLFRISWPVWHRSKTRATGQSLPALVSPDGLFGFRNKNQKA
jgi:hypothetical protein